MTPAPWADDRLAAAFGDRFNRPAPRELTATTLERVRTTPRRPRWWPVLDRSALTRLATAATVLAILALVVMPRTEPGPAASSPSILYPTPAGTPESSTPVSSAEPSPAVEGFAATVAGLRVRSVGDTTRLSSDANVGDTEVAVAGWYSARNWRRSCPARLRDDSPLIDRCGAFKAWLSGTPDAILGPDGQPIGGRTHGPTIEPWFMSPSDALIHLGVTGEDPWTTIEPQPLILIGHFHDDRSSRCKPTDAEACERTFVVDQYASQAGEIPTPGVVKPVIATRLDAVEALRIARQRVAGFGTVLKADLHFNSDAPWFSDSSSGCACPTTWFARGYRVLPDDTTDPRGPGTPVAGWLAIDDATSAISGTLDEGLSDLPAFTYAPPPQGFPSTIEGLPVRNLFDTVRADLPIRASGTPVAVAGWYSQLPLHPCPSSAADCNRETRVLAGSSRQLVRYVSGGGAMLTQPDAPVINPVMLSGGGSTPPTPGGIPIPVVFVMHQGDPRADQKGPGDPVGPRDWVLDQVAWLDGDDQPPSVWIPKGIHPTRSFDAVDVLSGERMHGPWWMISIAAVRGADLPSIGGPADRAATGLTWMVRATGTDPAAGDTGAPGWGVILVDDAVGTVTVGWTALGP